MNQFKRALQLCGLEQPEAAELLGYSLQSVKNWSAGYSKPPEAVWLKLGERWCCVERDAQDGASSGAATDYMDGFSRLIHYSKRVSDE